MAPASFTRATTGASTMGVWCFSSTAPPVETIPSVSMASLTVIGNPWSGPNDSPRAVASSALFADSRARSTSRVTTACTESSSRSARWTNRSSNSRDEISLPAIAVARSPALRNATSSPATVGPFLQMRALFADRGLVAVAREDDRLRCDLREQAVVDRADDRGEVAAGERRVPGAAGEQGVAAEQDRRALDE